MDNVYNRSLFAAKARPARNKLSKMGGIMSSSPELMEAQRNSMPSESSGVGAPMIQTAPVPAPMPTAPVPAPQSADQGFAYGGQVGAQNQLGQPTMAPYPGYAGAGALEMSPYEGSIDAFYNQPLHQYGQYLEKEYGKPDFPQKRNQFLQEVSQKEQQTFRNNNNMFNPYPLGGPNIGGNPMDFKIGQPLEATMRPQPGGNNSTAILPSGISDGFYGIGPDLQMQNLLQNTQRQGQFAAGGLIQGPGFDDGGPVDITESARLITPTSIALGSAALFTGLFNDFLGRSGEEFTNALGEKFSSKEAAEAAALEKKDSLDAAVATKNTDNIVNTVLDQSGLPLNDESKQDFARTVFGMENVNDIDEINRRIADVAIGSTIGKGPDEFAQAVLLGLGEYKKTATARATGVSGGSSSAKSRSAKNAYQDAYNKILSLDQIDVPKGKTKEQFAAESAESIVRRTYSQAEIDAANIQMGAPPSNSTTSTTSTTDQVPTEPGDRYKDRKTGKIMVVGPDGTPKEE